MSNCSCYTKWGTYAYECAYCWKLDNLSRDSIIDKLNAFTDEMAAELTGKERGSINIEHFWSQQPTPPGTSLPRFKYVSRYCTTNDWWAFKDLHITSELGNDPDYDLDEEIDCTGIGPCEYGTWLGYWWINETACDCVGPTPTSQGGGMAVGEMVKIYEIINLGHNKTVSKYLSLKAEWSEQSGRFCGSTVDHGQNPPQPDGYWVPKYKLKGHTLNLTYNRWDTKYQQEVENTVDHNC